MAPAFLEARESRGRRSIAACVYVICGDPETTRIVNGLVRHCRHTVRVVRRPKEIEKTLPLGRAVAVIVETGSGDQSGASTLRTLREFRALDADTPAILATHAGDSRILTRLSLLA